MSGYYQLPELDSKMPGHDHSLRKLYTIEGLSNPNMVYNWICPVLLREDCPYEALARIFSTTSRTPVGLIPVKTTLISDGLPQSSPSQTGLP